MGFSRQEYWSGLPFPSPVDHILSELSTMTSPSWVALHGMTHNFNELAKGVVQVIRLVSSLWLWFSVCLPSDGEGRGQRLWKLPDGRASLRGKMGLLMGGAMLSKCWTQFSVEGQGCNLTWGQTMVEVMKIMMTSSKGPMHMPLSPLGPAAGHPQPMPLLETPGPSWASLGQSLVGSLLLSPGSTQGSVCVLQESVSPALCKFWRLYGGVKGNLL